MNFHLPSPPVVVITLLTIFWIGELIFVRARRANKYAEQKDQGSLRWIILVIFGSVICGKLAKMLFPQATLEALLQLAPVGIAIFLCGVVLRWTSVIYLGRFFTIDVAIAPDQKVIDTGPYRHIRHPSYTGLIMIFLGMGICTGNAIAVVIYVLPMVFALLHRIAIEEAALSDAFGSRYTDYLGRTKRLIPFMY
jgi:protein-S-isoprenylcysteine O-methyltransferase